MDNLFQFWLLAFVSLFTMMNPIGVVPVYVSMTAGTTPSQSRRVALKATVSALAILTFFAFSGKFIFDFFQISTHSLRIVGGVIFFVVGYDMLNARLSRTKHDDESDSEFIEDIAITPLGIPMICGPGAITTVILMMNQSNTLIEKGILFSAVMAVLVITFGVLVGAKTIMNLIGENGNKVLMRVMGLLVMVIAVEFFFSGLKPILQEILG
ncbi:MAG: MarC family protein [bacterium]|nr:MarC family protein [bacterium]